MVYALLIASCMGLFLWHLVSQTRSRRLRWEQRLDLPGYWRLVRSEEGAQHDQQPGTGAGSVLAMEFAGRLDSGVCVISLQAGSVTHASTDAGPENVRKLRVQWRLRGTALNFTSEQQAARSSTDSGESQSLEQGPKLAADHAQLTLFDDTNIGLQWPDGTRQVFCRDTAPVATASEVDERDDPRTGETLLDGSDGAGGDKVVSLKDRRPKGRSRWIR